MTDDPSEISIEERAGHPMTLIVRTSHRIYLDLGWEFPARVAAANCLAACWDVVYKEIWGND